MSQGLKDILLYIPFLWSKFSKYFINLIIDHFTLYKSNESIKYILLIDEIPIKIYSQVVFEIQKYEHYMSIFVPMQFYYSEISTKVWVLPKS
jgi:hypothetical protein